jgi:hypothetical protein
MNDGRCGKVRPHSPSLKLAPASRHYVLDPFAFATVGERNEKSIRRAKNIHWRPVDLA